MPAHPFVRAYMAGVVVPTATVFAVAIVVGWYLSQLPAPIERAMIFPMAINAFVWGVWNALLHCAPSD